jgi:hypothetical protein
MGIVCEIYAVKKLTPGNHAFYIYIATPMIIKIQKLSLKA